MQIAPATAPANAPANAPATAEAQKPRIYDGFVKVGLLISLALFGLFLVWASFWELDEGVVANGTVSVESRTKTVQHLEGGIIGAVFVQEGDSVEQGQILLQLDTTQARVRRNQAQTQLLTTLARLDRLNAERKGFDAVAYRREITALDTALDTRLDTDLDTGLDTALVAEIRDVQDNLFDARRSQISGQIEILGQRIEQYADQIDGLAAQRTAAEQQIVLIQDEIDRYDQVAAQQATDVRSKLQRQRELAQVQGQLGQIDADVARTAVSIGEARIEILQVERTFQEAVADDLTDAQDRALGLRDELLGLDDILARTHILAPDTGAVLNMQYATIGGVIPGGQPIMEIVPSGDAFVVEAQITLNDVDNVVIGQDVRTTIAGLNQRTTPELLGAVVSIGADAVTDQVTGIPFFPVRVAFKAGEMSKLGTQTLRPGMGVQVFIQGGKRSPLNYFLQPILDTFKRALRET